MSMYGDKNSDPFFAELISKISQDIPVSVARYGDGEVMCAIAVRKGQGGTNADGDRYNPSLGKLLIDTFKNPINDPNFYYAYGPHCHKMGFTTRLKQDKIWNDSIKWQDAYVFINAGINGSLQQLIELLNEKPSILLAPKYLHDLPIDFDHKIAVAGKQAFGAYGEYEKKLREATSDGRQYIVILIAGMSATWMTHELFKLHGTKHSFLDFGSPFDAYALNSPIERSHFAHFHEDIQL